MNWENIVIALIGGVFGAGLAFILALMKVGPENLLNRSKAKKYEADAEDTKASAWIKLVQQQGARIETLDKRVGDLEAAIKAKDTLIDEQDAKIEAQGKEINDLRDAVEARDAQISALEEKVKILEQKRGPKATH
jgi:peptidoglycan hydrolase CwlO-like protein